jgi:hypothetical protein
MLMLELPDLEKRCERLEHEMGRIPAVEQQCASVNERVDQIAQRVEGFQALMVTAAKVAQERFARLAADWKAFESPSSSVTDLAMHPSYQQIIGMGEIAIPFIVEELEREPDHWFWALHCITGVDPVPEDDRGNIDAMSAAWIDWARKHGYEW